MKKEDKVGVGSDVCWGAEKEGDTRDNGWKQTRPLATGLYSDSIQGLFSLAITQPSSPKTRLYFDAKPPV